MGISTYNGQQVSDMATTIGYVLTLIQIIEQYGFLTIKFMNIDGNITQL